MNRRRLLKALAFAPGCFAGSALAGLQGASLSASETMLALAEALLGSDPLSARSREVLLEHLVLRSWPDSVLQDEYRACAKFLEGLAGVPFATLSIQARHKLLADRRMLPGSANEPAEDETARDIRNFVVPDLIAAYYRSPMGWAVVGYAAFPGRCAGLSEYTRTPT